MQFATKRLQLLAFRRIMIRCFLRSRSWQTLKILTPPAISGISRRRDPFRQSPMVYQRHLMSLRMDVKSFKFIYLCDTELVTLVGLQVSMILWRRYEKQLVPRRDLRRMEALSFYGNGRIIWKLTHWLRSGYLSCEFYVGFVSTVMYLL